MRFLILVLMVFLQACTTASSIVGSNRRTLGSLIDDSSFERNIKYDIEITLNPEISHINVNSFNRVILLTGEVGSQRDKRRAQEIAESYPNVRGVYNHVVVAPPSTVGNRFNDSLLTASVKKALLENKFVSSDEVYVVSERGEVYLMGILTAEEAKQAAFVASTVSGVLKVYPLFEILR